MLQGYGTRDMRALLLYPPGLEFIAAFFGCLYAGVIAVLCLHPISPSHSDFFPGFYRSAATLSPQSC